MRRTVCLLVVLALAPALTPRTTWASTGLLLGTQAAAAANDGPTPVVRGKRNKDHATLESSQKDIDRRLTAGDPVKKVTQKPEPRKPSRSKRSKDQVTTQISDPSDVRLNIGMCGRVQSDGTVPGPDWCQPVVPDERKVTFKRVPRPVTPRPQDVTWEQVRSETKNVVFPGLSVKVQPNGRTLVNLDTIVYTDESRMVTSTVTLLGFPVLVQATPLTYTWSFGDGSPALTTNTPGKPYPSKDITHKYMKRGTANLILTTNYSARFNVADTGWQYIDETIPVTGPATQLQIREAIPVLVDPDR